MGCEAQLLLYIYSHQHFRQAKVGQTDLLLPCDLKTH